MDEPETGGVHEPRRDPPDRGTPGEARVPGGSDDYLAATPDGDYPWPSIPEGYEAITMSPAYVSLDLVNFYEVPEGTSISDFLAEIREWQRVNSP